VTPAEFAEFTRRQPYKLVPHSFKGRLFSYPVCTGCGLVRARNEFTAWAVEKGCLSDDHPEYRAARKRFTSSG
jgi:hypothetical protein